MVIRGPVTLAPVAERLAVELSLPVFTTSVCRDRGSIPDLPHTRQTLYLYATVAVIINLKFRNQISLNYEENTVDAEFLVFNGKGLTLLEIDSASALFILKLGINSLKQNYVFQEFP